MWAAGSDNGASVHSAVNEYLSIDRDGLNVPTCRFTHGALKRVSGCILPGELHEQVTDVTALPGVVICKVL